MANKRISFECPECKAWQTLVLAERKDRLDIPCGQCGKTLTFRRLDQEMLDGCPVCGNQHLYQHKDFNKALGLGIFLIGVIFSFWTYHLSLIAALIIDAAIYPFFPWMVVCYRCLSEFRGWPKNPNLDRFNHEIAAHYEHYGFNPNKGGSGKDKS